MMGQAKQRRSVPPLREWLAKMCPSVNAADRDAFADFTDWTAGLLDQSRSHTPEEARALRMTQAASLAIVETCNAEAQKGVDNATISADMCRCLGISFGYAMMSLSWKDDAPLRSFAAPLAQEFRDGIKFAIDRCIVDEASDER